MPRPARNKSPNRKPAVRPQPPRRRVVEATLIGTRTKRCRSETLVARVVRLVLDCGHVVEKTCRRGTAEQYAGCRACGAGTAA